MTKALAGVPATPFSAPAPIVPPKVAAAVAQAVRDAHRAPPTTVLPGPVGYVEQTPEGGPYVLPAPPSPVAASPVEPVQPAPPTTTTTLPPTTVPVTVPGETTTTEGPGGGGGDDGSTTTVPPGTTAVVG
jgi:hypothetical protein